MICLPFLNCYSPQINFTSPALLSKPIGVPIHFLSFAAKHSFPLQRARRQSATSAGWDCRCTNLSGHDGVQQRQLQWSCGATVPFTIPHGGYRW